MIKQQKIAMSKKVLVTGGSGFIARNLVEQLSGQYCLSSLNRQEFDLLDSSGVFDYLKNNRFDVIVHTATYDAAPQHSLKDPSQVFINNLKMFFNLTRCSEYFGKMIYFGSGAEFSRINWVPKMKEDYFDRHVPEDQYGFSKYVMAKQTQHLINVCNLRLFAVFGKYEDWRVRVISSICRNAVLDLPITIKRNAFFDFIYIDDLIKIVKWFIDNKPKEKIYNVCTGRVVDFKTIAEKVIKLSGKNLEIIINTDELGSEYSGNNSLLLKELGGFKFSSIDDSIKALYDWYSSNKETILKTVVKE